MGGGAGASDYLSLLLSSVVALLICWSTGPMQMMSLRGQLLCDLNQIQVTHSVLVNASSSAGGGDNWYRVRVANECPCSAAAAITFFCDGFSQALVRPEVLRVEGARCLLINGEALINLQPVAFHYRFQRLLPLLLESADFTC